MSTGEMSDNFSNFPPFQIHEGSPFAPPQMKRRSLGVAQSSLSPLDNERAQSLPSTFVNPMPPPQYWPYNCGAFGGSDSYVDVDACNEQNDPLGDEVSSPSKRRTKRVASKPKNVRLDKGKNREEEGVKNEGGTPNKRWPDAHSEEMLKVLCYEAEQGRKCDKSFKREAFTQVCNHVNKKFGECYTALNVHNHLRGWKKKWLEILKAKDLSGAGWDEESKMIILDKDTHEDLIKVIKLLLLFNTITHLDIPGYTRYHISLCRLQKYVILGAIGCCNYAVQFSLQAAYSGAYFSICMPANSGAFRCSKLHIMVLLGLVWLLQLYNSVHLKHTHS